MLTNWFEFCFEGCGTSLEQALRSDRYAELVRQNQELTQVPGSDEDVAFKAGHLVMGRLFNNMPEVDAIRTAKCESEEYGHGFELRPLIQFLGESLVAAARQCFSPEMERVSALWGESSADEQIELVRTLYHELLGDDEDEFGGDMSIAVAHRKIHARLNRETGPKTYLPQYYGKWDRSTCPAQCQGKTQLMTAFARSVGARTLAVAPVTLLGDVTSAYRNEAIHRMQRDIRERRLSVSPEFGESQTAQELLTRSNFHESFHVGCAIELRDGRWILLDSHGKSWGVYNASWDIPGVITKLEKYEGALPGLSLMAHDGDEAQVYLTKKLELVDDLLERSRRAEVAIRDAELSEMIEILSQSDDLSLLARLNAESRGEEWPEEDPFDLPIARQLALMGIFEKTVFRALDEGWDLMEFARSEWLTFYHAVAADVILNQVAEGGILVHPIAEFSLPEYSLAMSALNNVHVDEDPYQDQADLDFFINYAFDQTNLYNAASTTRPETVRAAACRAMMAMPVKHPLTERRLKGLGL